MGTPSRISREPDYFWGYFGGIEDERADTGADHFGKLIWRQDWDQLPIIRPSNSFGAFTYQRSLYETGDPIFLVRRHDSFFDLSLGYRFKYNNQLSISPTVVYNDNDSNILTNDYDRLEVMVTARYDF